MVFTYNVKIKIRSIIELHSMQLFLIRSFHPRRKFYVVQRPTLLRTIYVTIINLWRFKTSMNKRWIVYYIITCWYTSSGETVFSQSQAIASASPMPPHASTLSI